MSHDQDRSDYDLIVIGGGPAGAAAAITAAHAGVQVLLLERGRLPRQRVCGEFVSAESLELLSRLLSKGDDHVMGRAVRIPEGRLFVEGHRIKVPLDPPAASISRFAMDWALWRAAEEAGVHARLETAVEGVSGDGPFQVRTPTAAFAARAVIDASGRWSNLSSKPARQDGKVQPGWLGVKAHFLEAATPMSVDLYFFEGGYCGVQPVSAPVSGRAGTLNACAMMRADVAHTLLEVLALHPELRERSRTWKPVMEPVTTSPLIFQEPRPAEGGALRVGDAAGFVDPFVGDGISLALRSGAAAASCLLPFFRQKTSLRAATAEYCRTYERRLLPVFQRSSRIRRLLKLPPPWRRTILHLLECAPAVTRYMVAATR